MVATKLKNTRALIKGAILMAETISSEFATAKTVAGAGGTVPSGTTQIVCIPSGACHYHPGATAPTASFGHAAAEDEPFVIEHAQIANCEIIDDAETGIDLVVLYLG